jgi:hypothetical protein
VNCKLHELHILGEPYEMSVRAYQLRELIEMVKMIVQIMSFDDCVTHTNLDTNCVRCKNYSSLTNYAYCTNCTDEVE